MTAFYPVWPYIKDNDVPTIYDIMDVHLFNSYMEQHHKALVPFAKVLTNNIVRREKPFYQHINAVCGLGINQVEIAKRRTGKTARTLLEHWCGDIAVQRCQQPRFCFFLSGSRFRSKAGIVQAFLCPGLGSRRCLYGQRTKIWRGRGPVLPCDPFYYAGASE